MSHALASDASTALLGAAAFSSFPSVVTADERPRQQIALGLLTYCFALAQRAVGKVRGVRNYNDPVVFIEEASSMGANAVQLSFGNLSAEPIKRIRERAEALGIALEATLALPASDADLPKFTEELRTASELGANIVRTVVFPGRRYEDLHSAEAYRGALQSARERLHRAEPLARKYHVRLAVENHKDQRMEERLKLFEELGSEHIGACVDVGNNLALLEDPLEVARALSPWALTVHFKDQGVREYEEGFLLADVPLGQGCIDLLTVIRILREKKPTVRFQLELITRDPLRVPVLADSYWPTFLQVKARDLGRTWAMIKEKGSHRPFPTISDLSDLEKVALERRNIEESFEFAAAHLELALSK